MSSDSTVADATIDVSATAEAVSALHIASNDTTASANSEATAASVVAPPPAVEETQDTPKPVEARHHGSRYTEPKSEFCSIEAKTQSGESINIEKFEWNNTIAELKKMIHPKLKNFDIDEIRLLHHGKPLNDDAAVIDTLGFKNKETVFIVRKLKGISTDPPPPPVDTANGNVNGSSGVTANNSTPGELMTVKCPVGCSAGSRVQVTPPGRPPLIVIVPAGVVPGGLFRVALPPLQPTQQAPAPLPASNLTQSQIMAVACPAGLRPGDLMEVMVPGRGRMRVPIPDGVAPGQVFRFRVPN